MSRKGVRKICQKCQRTFRDRTGASYVCGACGTALAMQIGVFNDLHPPGSLVIVTRGDGARILTVTESEAQVLFGHTAVVWLRGISGCYLLDRVQAVPRTLLEEVQETVRMGLERGSPPDAMSARITEVMDVSADHSGIISMMVSQGTMLEVADGRA